MIGLVHPWWYYVGMSLVAITLLIGGVWLFITDWRRR